MFDNSRKLGQPLFVMLLMLTLVSSSQIPQTSHTRNAHENHDSSSSDSDSNSGAHDTRSRPRSGGYRFRRKPEIFAPDLYDKGQKRHIMVENANGELVSRYVIFYEGLYIEQGDLIIGTSLLSARIIKRRWECSIPYKIHSSVLFPSRVRTALKHWEDKTRWSFVERSYECDFVLFEAGSGCASSLGKVGDVQSVVLAPECTVGEIIHEIGHIIGLEHEHIRSDRDNYVEIITENISDDAKINFEIFNLDESEDFGNYDLGSVMHYGLYDYSKNGKQTIRPKHSTEDIVVGQREGVSKGDAWSADDMRKGCVETQQCPPDEGSGRSAAPCEIADMEIGSGAPEDVSGVYERQPGRVHGKAYYYNRDHDLFLYKIITSWGWYWILDPDIDLTPDSPFKYFVHDSSETFDYPSDIDDFWWDIHTHYSFDIDCVSYDTPDESPPGPISCNFEIKGRSEDLENSEINGLYYYGGYHNDFPFYVGPNFVIFRSELSGFAYWILYTNHITFDSNTPFSGYLESDHSEPFYEQGSWYITDGTVFTVDSSIRIINSCTSSPSSRPTAPPTSRPSAPPTSRPSAPPTSHPTAPPTSRPSAPPTSRPSAPPTARPTAPPTSPPSAPPTSRPTAPPTSRPSAPPTSRPTAPPTTSPTPHMTSTPTAQPTTLPTIPPTIPPTTIPSPSLSIPPTNPPTPLPTPRRTVLPTSPPTPFPTISPTLSPTPLSTLTPTTLPTILPTSLPTVQPTPAPHSPSPTSLPTPSSSTTPSESPTVPAPSVPMVPIPSDIRVPEPTAHVQLHTPAIPALHPPPSPSLLAAPPTIPPPEAPLPPATPSFNVSSPPHYAQIVYGLLGHIDDEYENRFSKNNRITGQDFIRVSNEAFELLHQQLYKLDGQEEFELYQVHRKKIKFWFCMLWKTMTKSENLCDDAEYSAAESSQAALHEYFDNAIDTLVDLDQFFHSSQKCCFCEIISLRTIVSDVLSIFCNVADMKCNDEAQFQDLNDDDVSDEEIHCSVFEQEKR